MTETVTGFENTQIDINSLPQSSNLDLKPLSRTRAWIEAFYVIIFGLVPVLISNVIVFFAVEPDERVLLISIYAGVYLILLFAISWTYLAAKNRRFALRDKDVVLKTGLMNHRLAIIPINRIQHVELHRPFLDRKYGLATMAIYTAGASSVDAQIPGLEEAEAVRIQAFILDKMTGADLDD